MERPEVLVELSQLGYSAASSLSVLLVVTVVVLLEESARVLELLAVEDGGRGTSLGSRPLEVPGGKR